MNFKSNILYNLLHFVVAAAKGKPNKRKKKQIKTEGMLKL